ncbi:MAG: diaminopimelate decarboxylase [Candidatus Riflebacteria bacterium]|nr:diaminopimelate decarboxylase [Candidatus Riflebacteria bacterium]
MNLSEKRIVGLAEKYGTPLYLYDAEVIRSQIRKAKKVFEGLDVRIFFALKANSNTALLSIMKEMGIGADVVGPGEIFCAKKAGISEMILNGNGKTVRIRDSFINAGGKYVSIDSLEEMKLWQNERLVKFLRINPNVVAGGHPSISTGGSHHKFGVSINEIDKCAEEIQGLHVHIGSQITTVDPFEEAYSRVVQISNRLGFSWLDIGGGWGIRYKDSELDLEEFRRRIVPILSNFKGKIAAELGRFIIASAGSLILRVTEVKRAGKIFVTADGGMNVLMRPALYDAYHKITPVGPVGKPEICDVVGPLCETGDVLAKNREMAIPQPGALLMVENTGAYGYSMSNNYNGMPRPAEILLENEDDKLIRPRESVEGF